MNSAYFFEQGDPQTAVVRLFLVLWGVFLLLHGLLLVLRERLGQEVERGFILARLLPPFLDFLSVLRIRHELLE